MTLLGKTIASGIATYAVLGITLFWAAGTLDWPAGWSFFGVFVTACLAVTRWMYLRAPGLLEERMRVASSQTSLDRVFITLIVLGWFTWWLLGPLDYRYGWSHVPVWLQVAGAVLSVASFPLFYAVFRANPFASPVVRVQDDRGQVVIDTGPYAHVRHPMYAAATAFVFGTALWLGSWWQLVGAAALVVVLATRSIHEERTLARELRGYADYERRVRFRLVPHVW